MAAKRPKPVPQMTAAQFDAAFPDEEACKAYLVARRWPDGVHCPRCGNPKVYDLKSRRWHWQCEQCAPDGYRFSHIAGTIFENTNKSLRDWFKVAHLMLDQQEGHERPSDHALHGLRFLQNRLGHVPQDQNRPCREHETSSGALSRSMRLSSAARTKTNIGTSGTVAACPVTTNRRSSALSAQGQRRRPRA